MNKIIRSCIAFLIAVSPAATYAHDEFDFFEEEAKVVTAARRSQSISDSPVTIEVITHDEIQAAGAINLWDLMRYRAGMDVLDARTQDGNRAIVSVRGFVDEFVNGLLVLVDGRSVYSSYSGGVFWQSVPVQIQDIERIEIVRGPNAALYGSNASYGVVNIITKAPEKDGSGSLAVLGGDLNLFETQESVQGSLAGGAMRVSHTYRTEDGFPNERGKKAHDGLVSHKANMRGDWDFEKGSLQLHSGYSSEDQAYTALSDGDQDFRTHYQMIKGGLKTGPKSSIEVLLARKDFLNRSSSRDYRYDAEVLHTFAWGPSNTTWGGSYRNAVANAPGVFGINGPEQQNQTLRGFGHQSVKLGTRWSLIGAASIEESDVGGTEPAYQASVLHQFNRDHLMRASYARAPILPAIVEQRIDILIPPDNPFVPALAIQGDPDTRPVDFWSYELGYQGDFINKRLRWENNVFYMAQRDMILLTGPQFVPPATLLVTSENRNRAVARGLETKFRLRMHRGSLYVNHTYEKIRDQDGNRSVTDTTPEHKVNVGGLVKFSRNWSGSVDCGYKDGYTFVPLGGAPVNFHPYWRVDSRLAYSRSNYEVFLLAQNLTRSRHHEAPEVVFAPRRVLVGGSLKFGTRR